MKLILLGLNHQASAIEERERWRVPPSQTLAFIQGLFKIPKVRGVLYLATCNRVEIYASVEEGFSLSSLTTYWRDFLNLNQKEFSSHYSYVGQQAFAHLLRVASGLNSLALGETQILGQVKEAYQNALELKVTDSLLNFVFQQAFRIAKKIRTETGITRCPTSISSVALQLAEQFFGSFEKRTALVIGLGEMGAETAGLLFKRRVGKLIVTNRTREVAEEFATQWDAQVYPFNRFQEVLPLADLVITATAAERPILSSETFLQTSFSRNRGPQVLIDLGVPRDIDPAVANIAGCYLYNIDDLKTIAAKNLAFRKQEAFLAEEMIQKAVSDFDNQWERRKVDKDHVARNVIACFRSE